MTRSLRVAAAILLWAGPHASALAAQSAVAAPARTTPFALTVARLSEPAGYFDTDNLISNEASYLHPIPALRRLGVRGGAYVGVGPDQNFAYIAAVRPRVAYIIDIRRDNLLQHLLLRALMIQAPTRIEFLAHLLGRAAPADAAEWRGRSVGDITAMMADRKPDTRAVAARRAELLATLRGFGVPLADADLATIDRFHGEFIREGLALRFTTHGREPQWYYPTYRQLLEERDNAGRQTGFLSSEDDYAFLRAMQREGRIIPVVGDLSGPHALRAIGAEVRKAGLRVSAFYTSNVEFYLNGPGQFARYAANVAALPTTDRSMIIRSYFPGRWGRHPRAVEGYHTTQLLQRVRDFAQGVSRQEFPTYWDLVTRRTLD
jgi:hypothetical protein